MTVWVLLVVLIPLARALARPNVLFIIADDLRPSLGVYDPRGPHRTPHIDALASRGFVFTRAYVQQSVCSPSRTSFFTSRRPDTTKTLNNNDTEPIWRRLGNLTTLPQHFKTNGYHAVSIGKTFCTTNSTCSDYPYSWSVPTWHPPTEAYKMAKVCPNEDGSLHMNLLCPVDVASQPGGSLPDIQSTDYALKMFESFARNATSQTPFFLAVGYHKPHIPLKFPAHYLDLHPIENVTLPENRRYPPGLPPVAWDPWTDVRLRDDVAALNLSFPYGPMDDDFARKIIQHYHASVTYVDDQIGRLLQGLDEYENLASNTLVVFIGDHGWQLGENQEWAKYSNFETAVRTPLIVRLPSKQPSGPVYVDALVELVDLMPTLSEVAGLSVPPLCPESANESTNVSFCTEGVSFVPLLQQTNSSVSWKKAVFSQYPRPSDYPAENSDTPMVEDIRIMGYSIRTESYRYTEWVGYDTEQYEPRWDEIHARELYNHTANHREDNNLASSSQYADLIATLSIQLKKGWHKALP